MDIINALNSLLVKGYDARIEKEKIIVDLPRDCVMVAEDIQQLIKEEYRIDCEVRDFQ